MLEDHLDGDNPQEPIFDMYLFDFVTQKELHEYLVNQGYLNAGTVAKKVFVLKGQMAEKEHSETLAQLAQVVNQQYNQSTMASVAPKTSWFFSSQSYQLSAPLERVLKTFEETVEEYYDVENENPFLLRPYVQTSVAFSSDVCIRNDLLGLTSIFIRELSSDTRRLNEVATLTSAGGGKTHFLDALYAHFTRNKLRDPLPDREHKYKVYPVYITFNSGTDYSSNEQLDPFLSRIVYEIRKTHSPNLKWTDALPQIQHQFKEIPLRKLIAKIHQAAQEVGCHLVFLIDEVVKLVRQADQGRSILTSFKSGNFQYLSRLQDQHRVDYLRL